MGYVIGENVREEQKGKEVSMLGGEKESNRDH